MKVRLDGILEDRDVNVRDGSGSSVGSATFGSSTVGSGTNGLANIAAIFGWNGAAHERIGSTGNRLDVDATATNLDIRDLSAAQDNLEAWVHDGTGTAIGSGAAGGLDVALHDDGGAPFTSQAPGSSTIADAGNALVVSSKPYAEDGGTIREITAERDQDEDAGDDGDTGMHVSDIRKYWEFDDTTGGALEDLAIDYDDSPTSATSDSMDTKRGKVAVLYYTLSSTLLPTRIEFTVEGQPEGELTEWYNDDSQFLSRWAHEDQEVATARNFAQRFYIEHPKIRIKVDAFGTDATNFFTLSNLYLVIRN